MLRLLTSYLFANVCLLDSVFDASTVEAEAISRLHSYFYWAAGFILLVVIAATAYILYTFKEKSGQPFTAKTLSNRLEFFFIGVPLALVIIFFLLALQTMHRVLPAAAGKTPDVIITGHQFWWEAHYPAQGVTTANEIHLPVQRRLLIKFKSADVIHDWWVPQFGNKMDVISGRENYLWMQIKKPGVYQGACSEFCGAQHAGMHIIVIAQPEAEYQQWLLQQQQTAVPGSDLEIQKGAVLFQAKTCANCHAIHGTNAAATTGPDLTHLASRQTLLTGLIKNNTENLSRWIQNPQAFKPGAKMPAFVLDTSSLKALTAYLASLK